MSGDTGDVVPGEAKLEGGTGSLRKSVMVGREYTVTGEWGTGVSQEEGLVAGNMLVHQWGP